VYGSHCALSRLEPLFGDLPYQGRFDELIVPAGHDLSLDRQDLAERRLHPRGPGLAAITGQVMSGALSHGPLALCRRRFFRSPTEILEHTQHWRELV
jgi:hypothetical protein